MYRQSVTNAVLPKLQEFFTRWGNCQSCVLRKRPLPVLFRGQIPCDVMFLTNAPTGEDMALGMPMTGSVGKELDGIIFGANMSKLRYVITSAVACSLPEDRKPRNTDREERKACLPRLVEFVTICKPKLIVTLGKDADMASISLISSLPEMVRTLAMDHPSGFAFKEDPEFERQNCIVNLREALLRVFPQLRPKSSFK